MSTATCERPSIPIARRRFLRGLSGALCAAHTTALLAPAASAFAQPARPSDTASSGLPTGPSVGPAAAASDASATRPAGYTVTAWPAGHQDRLNPLRAHDLHQVVEVVRLRTKQSDTVERASQVPVRGVQQPHTPTL